MLGFEAKKDSYVLEMAQITKNASACCAASANFVRMLHQRWSPRGRPWPRGRPRGHILKSLALALASKVKSLALASRPQVLENWPVLGSRTAVFFELLKFCGALEKFFRKRFFVEIAGASRVSVLGKAVLGLGLEPCVLDSTSVLHRSAFKHN